MLTFPPDISFVVQIVSFLVLWFGLKRLLFDPTLKVLDERERRTAGAQKAAAELRETATSAAADYDQRLHDIRLKLAGETEAARNAIQTDERKVLADAREQATAQLSQLRERLTRQVGEARPALASEAAALAQQMTDRLLGRPAV